MRSIRRSIRTATLALVVAAPATPASTRLDHALACAHRFAASALAAHEKHRAADAAGHAYWTMRCATWARLPREAGQWSRWLLEHHPETLHARLVRVPAADLPVRPLTWQELLHAIARVESNHDPKAVSSAGAVGLMQVLPSTAAEYLSRPEVTDACLRDARCNTAVARAHLERLSRRHHGNLLAVLAAYNAGERASRRWAVRTARDDPLYAIDAIPYEETRHYVRKVLLTLWRNARADDARCASEATLARHAWPRMPDPP